MIAGAAGLHADRGFQGGDLTVQVSEQLRKLMRLELGHKRHQVSSESARRVEQRLIALTYRQRKLARDTRHVGQHFGRAINRFEEVVQVVARLTAR